MFLSIDNILYVNIYENILDNKFGSISKREKGDIVQEDKKIGDHELITTFTQIDSSTIYNPAQLLSEGDTLAGWSGVHCTITN